MIKVQVKNNFVELDKLKELGVKGRVVVGFWGAGSYGKARTLTASIAERHMEGRGVPPRNPIGIDEKDERFIRRIEQQIIQQKVTPEEGLKRIGEHIMKSTRERNLAGRNIDGSRYEDYSEAYKKRRAKRQRRINVPDLTFTGIMWGSYGSEVQMEKKRGKR